MTMPLFTGPAATARRTWPRCWSTRAPILGARNGVMVDVAAAYGHARVLEFLLKRGAKLEENGGLALKWAKENNQASLRADHRDASRGTQKSNRLPKPPTPPTQNTPVQKTAEVKNPVSKAPVP